MSADARVIICLSNAVCAQIEIVAGDGTTVRGELSPGGPAATVGAAVDAVNPGAGRASGENFPVALRMLPSRRRRYLMAVYGFARTADDIGDEAPAEQRAALLDELEADVRRLYARLAAGPGPGEGRAGASGNREPAGQAGGGQAGQAPGGPAGRRPAGLRARWSARSGLRSAECGIPMQPFLDLIEANRQDQVVIPLPDVRGPARLLPAVGQPGRPDRAVRVRQLHASGGPSCPTPSAPRCSWPSTGRTWPRTCARAGSTCPRQDLDAFGCTEAGPGAAQRAAAGARADRVRDRAGDGRCSTPGAPLIGTLRGAARVAVAGYVAGGRAALAAIAAAGHDVLRATPRPGKRRLAAELLLALREGAVSR